MNLFSSVSVLDTYSMDTPDFQSSVKSWPDLWIRLKRGQPKKSGFSSATNWIKGAWTQVSSDFPGVKAPFKLQGRGRFTDLLLRWSDAWRCHRRGGPMAGGESLRWIAGRCPSLKHTPHTCLCIFDVRHHITTQIHKITRECWNPISLCLPDLLRVDSSAGHCWSSMVASFSCPICAVEGSSPRSTSRSDDIALRVLHSESYRTQT